MTLCLPANLQVLPFFQFYRGTQGKVAEFSASVSKIQRIRYACSSLHVHLQLMLQAVALTPVFCRDALAEHSTPRCDIGSIERVKEFPDVEPHLVRLTLTCHVNSITSDCLPGSSIALLSKIGAL